MYRIEIKAKWNDVTLAVWQVPEFLVVSIGDVREFVKEHIYKCSIFDECYCRVTGDSSDSANK